MKTKKSTFIAALVGLVAILISATGFAVEGNDKRGRVYFKMVCTACHMATAGKTIPPNTKTMAQWMAYMKANKHDKTKETKSDLRYYMSTAYRESIKDSNKAAKKFLTVPEAQIHADVESFVVSGARDSDTPASCD